MNQIIAPSGNLGAIYLGSYEAAANTEDLR